MASNLLTQALNQVATRNRQQALAGNQKYAENAIENVYSGYFDDAMSREQQAKTTAASIANQEEYLSLAKQNAALTQGQAAFQNALAMEQLSNQKSSGTATALSNLAGLGTTLYAVDKMTGSTGQKALTSLVTTTPAITDTVAGYGTMPDITGGTGTTWGSAEYTQTLSDLGLTESDIASLSGTSEGWTTSVTDAASSLFSSAWSWLTDWF